MNPPSPTMMICCMYDPRTKTPHQSPAQCRNPGTRRQVEWAQPLWRNPARCGTIAWGWERCSLKSSIVSDRSSIPRPVGRSLRFVLCEAGRKVRTGQGAVVANGHREQSQGKCHRKHTADGLVPTRSGAAGQGSGKGEMVRQERTAAAVTSPAGKTPPPARPSSRSTQVALGPGASGYGRSAGG